MTIYKNPRLERVLTASYLTERDAWRALGSALSTRGFGYDVMCMPNGRWVVLECA